MIGSLTGLVDHAGKDEAIIDVGGVGYLVFASARTLDALPPAGSSVRLMIETHVREDHIHLYGFADRQERDWFRLLTTVQGVGARVALALLSVLTPDALATAIAAQDRAAIAQAEGIGPKLAARILNELRDKAGVIGGDPLAGDIAGGRLAAGTGAPQGATAEAVSALVNLGYGRSEAFAAVNRAAGAAGDDATVEQLIPLALKDLSG
ncbi:MAG: Holliday junction branch migration protein RuvA [Rhodospirillaceae bacterium]|nr:Holliday junction branch migration protein RuvA [Rhodospirillaceae bacterium]